MAIGRVLAIALVAALASACGAGTTKRAGAPTASPPAAPAALGPPATSDDRAGSGSIMVFTDATSTERAQEVYAVFHRPLEAGDRAAAAVAQADGFLPTPGGTGPAADQLGRPIYSETRLVAGTTRRGVYATPTTSGAVCIGRFPNGGGGCGRPGPHGITLQWDDQADGSPLELYGMAADDVKAVELVVSGKPQTAGVEGNAFVLDVPSAGHADMGSIVLHLTDGRTVELG